MPVTTSPLVLSDEAYPILQDAVRIVKERNIRTVAALRKDLSELYPGQEDDIREALMFWAHYEKSKRMH